jgi:hypothetical protein
MVKTVDEHPILARLPGSLLAKVVLPAAGSLQIKKRLGFRMLHSLGLALFNCGIDTRSRLSKRGRTVKFTLSSVLIESESVLYQHCVKSFL